MRLPIRHLRLVKVLLSGASLRSRAGRPGPGAALGIRAAWRSFVLGLAVWLTAGLAMWPSPASAQLGARLSAAGLGGEAYAGKPFGVGRITLSLPEEALPEPLGAEGLRVSDPEGRVLYPAVGVPVVGNLLRGVVEQTPLFSGGPVRQEVGGLLRELLKQPAPTTIYFLFRGEGPLELFITGRQQFHITLVPRDDPLRHEHLLDVWWRQYSGPVRLLELGAEQTKTLSPVENFLQSTLARRLDLRLPERQQTEDPREMLKQQLGLLTGSESVRLAMAQNRLLMLHEWHLPAQEPLPQREAPPPLELPGVPEDVPIEPIALRVPPECYYVRFGSFANFLWLQDRLRTFGSLGDLLAARGQDYDLAARIERQIALRQTELSRILGAAVVTDVALIGTDTFFCEGAAFGLLFHARNNTMLAAEIARQRKEQIEAGKAEEREIELAGRPVRYLSSPDGRIRSYYAADGDYHLVTTSRHLAERFLEVGAGSESLGSRGEFRVARQRWPLGRHDTVWIYLSDAFFENLTGPHYRVEMIRRLQAAADIEIVQLARLAAKAEGKPAETIEQLIAGSLLPPDFGPRGDGSRTVLADGRVFDSLRGQRGAFLPVPDVPVEGLSTAELAQYERFERFYREQWGRMDPTTIALRRQAQAGGREQIVVDMQLSPFAAQHFELLSRLAGPPQQSQLAAIQGDLARFELVMPGQRVFGGLRDRASGAPAAIALPPRSALEKAPAAYLGTTSQEGLLGLLELLGVRLGIARAWEDELAVVLRPVLRRSGPFTVFSPDASVLDEVVPQLRLEEGPAPAQLRINVADLSQARAAPLLGVLGTALAQETSLGNLRLLHALEQQLHVPGEECRRAAEVILDARLRCPLGGEYVYRRPAVQPRTEAGAARGQPDVAPQPGAHAPLSGPALAGPTVGQSPQAAQSAEASGFWTSTALEGPPAMQLGGRPLHIPPGYHPPPLSWFRGLELYARMTERVLEAHAEVLMQLPPQPAGARSATAQ